MSKNSIYFSDDSQSPATSNKPTKKPFKSRPYIYSPICECGTAKDRRSERCKSCQRIFDKRILRPLDPLVYIVECEQCRKIALTKEQWALVSAVDYPSLMEHNWIAWWNTKTRSYYAKRVEKRNGQVFTIMMHNAVFGPVAPGNRVDHRSVNSLDNRRTNLREATHGQNMCNSGKRQNNTSGYKGVTWSKKHRKWVAQIGKDRTHHYLGLFDDPEVAHQAYCEAAKRLHGEFARFA
jgi:hypothetical protein